jgi:hypothetical protein
MAFASRRTNTGVADQPLYPEYVLGAAVCVVMVTEVPH